ncbi:purine-binding chemotaxis protein CheW [Candidatus Sumerlaeota bacterium]|nr:purine-binding chemotaxis protein CheW [Candidatus Sumerlaeota bacterium]
MRETEDHEVEFVTFHVKDSFLGVDTGKVREIISDMNMTEVPHAPSHVRGIMNLRGEIVTVIDLSVKLGHGPTEITPETCHVVLAGEEPVALLVDRIGDVVRDAASGIEPPPVNVTQAEAELFEGVLKRENELLTLLRVDEVLRVEESKDQMSVLAP